MWRLSWGSLARGSGGSNSPVKSSQLSRTRRKRENMLEEQPEDNQLEGWNW